jgi:hypothetical protein
VHHTEPLLEYLGSCWEAAEHQGSGCVAAERQLLLPCRAQALKAAELSVHCLRWAAAYVKRHDLRERMEEAGLASDLADLVQSKLSLLQRGLQL